MVELFSHLKYSSYPSVRPFNTLSKEVGCHNLKNKQNDIQQRGSVALPRTVMPTRSNSRENSFHVIKLFAFGKFIYLCLYHSRTAYPVMHYRVSSISINILFNEFPTISFPFLALVVLKKRKKCIRSNSGGLLATNDGRHNKNRKSNEESHKKAFIVRLCFLFQFSENHKKLLLRYHF